MIFGISIFSKVHSNAVTRYGLIFRYGLFIKFSYKSSSAINPSCKHLYAAFFCVFYSSDGLPIFGWIGVMMLVVIFHLAVSHTESSTMYIFFSSEMYLNDWKCENIG